MKGKIGQGKAVNVFISFIVILLVLAIVIFIILKPKDILKSFDDCLAKGGTCSPVCAPGENQLSTCSDIDFCCVDPEKLIYGIEKDSPEYLTGQVETFERYMVGEAADHAGVSKEDLLEQYEDGKFDPEYCSETYQYKHYETDLEQLRTIKTKLAKAQGIISQNCESNLIRLEEAIIEGTPAYDKPFFAICETSLPGEDEHLGADDIIATVAGQDCSFGGWNQDNPNQAQFTCPGIKEAGTHQFACVLDNPCTPEDDRIRVDSFTLEATEEALAEENTTTTNTSTETEEAAATNTSTLLARLRLAFDEIKDEFSLMYAEKVLIVDGERQELYVVSERNNQLILHATYPISTATAGFGTQEGSKKTPTGIHEIGNIYGMDAALGTIFDDRTSTGEIATIHTDATDTNDDLVTTRILWLSGLQATNENTYDRYIYIHGTPEEGLIGTPASNGCIRMKNEDIIALANTVTTGTYVSIQERLD